MADTFPTSSGDRTVVIHRHGVLTWISLGFNALILLLILIGIVCHHHRGGFQHRCGGWGGHHERQDWGNRGRGDFGHRDFRGSRGDGDRRDGDSRDEDRGQGGDGDRGNRGGFDKSDRQNWGTGQRGFGGQGFDHPKGPGDFKGITPPTPEAMTDRFMLVLTDKLKLTDQESTQIRPILQDQITAFQKDMEAQKAAHQKMIDDAKAKIRPILTPDQQKQFDQLTAGLDGPGAAPASK